MTHPTETEIMNAIRYALRSHPVEEEQDGDEGCYVSEIYEAESLEPFVMCLLRELKVIP